MPSREREPRGPPSDREPSREPEPQPYHHAARFRNEPRSARAYFRLQDVLFQHHDADLSAYRFQFHSEWHVAVLGEAPPQEVDAQVQGILRAGEPVPLPDHVLGALIQRREEAKQEGDWVERHHRPGEPLF